MGSRKISATGAGEKPRNSGLSRRTMLAGTAAVGAATVLPPWLSGCGPLPNAVFGQAITRERRTLHFDLSHLDAGAIYTLNVVRSASHRQRLRAHTARTRAKFRQENSLLRQIADEKLTHYLEGVDLPANALQHIWITTTGPDGVTAVASSHIHVPSSAYSSLARAKRRNSASGRVIESARHAKLKQLNVSQVSQQTPSLTLSDLNSIHTAVDAAVAVVFHHPEIMNLDPSVGAQVLDVIQNLEGNLSSCIGDNIGPVGALACAISRQGLATTTSGWMRRVPALDPDGNPVLDDSGNPIYENVFSDETEAAALPVIQQVLKVIYNDPSLRASRLTANPGATSASADADAGTATGGSTGKARNARADSSFQVSLAHPAGSIGSNLHGLMFRDFSVSNDDTRSVSVKVENIYLRWCDAYVQFLQADGVTPILNSDGSFQEPQHLALVPSDDAIMGIPLLDQGTLQKTTLEFDMPQAASFANLIFGTIGVGSPSLGNRNQFDLDEVVKKPIIYTDVFNIGIPGFFLTLGIGLQDSQALKSITQDNETLLAVVAVLAPLYAGGQATRGALQGSARGPIIDTAKLMISLVLKKVPSLAAKLLGYASSQELLDSVPFLGWALRALGMVGGIAQLAETVGEVLSSPVAFDNLVSFAMDMTVTLNHDPLDFEFPATAKTWIVRATYDGTVVREVCGTLETTQSDPLVAQFTGVPVGGQVQIDVWFLSDDNWIVGQGGTGTWQATGGVDETGAPIQRWVPQRISNFPDTAGAVNITIKEQLVPLTRTTTYSHKEKMTYANGQHAWAASVAPAVTHAALDPTRNDTLHSLGAITVNQAAGSVGYSWRTGTSGVSVCSGDNGDARSVQLVQNLSLTQHPDSALKAPDCGHIDKPALAYALMAPLQSTGRLVYVDPKYGPYVVDDQTTMPYRYFVRPVKLDSLADTSPLSSSAGQAWGFFTLPSDGLAVHPLGHVVSINTANSKMEILHLPGTPVADADASAAVMASGFGAQPGLLNSPVAIGVSPSGAVLVLDAGNGRVQAFDTFGNVNNIFSDGSGNAVNYFALRSTDATAYLDLAIESAVGYMFVLYYVNQGSSPNDYILDIYTKNGEYLTQTVGMAAARLALDYWRNVYTLNYEKIVGPGGRLEPSVSQWIPSTPPGNDPNALAALAACAQ